MDGTCSSFLRSLCRSYSGNFSLQVVKFVFICYVFDGEIDKSTCLRDDVIYEWLGLVMKFFINQFVKTHCLTFF